MFPNVTEVEAVTSRDQPFQVFNTIFFVVVMVGERERERLKGGGGLMG